MRGKNTKGGWIWGNTRVMAVPFNLFRFDFGAYKCVNVRASVCVCIFISDVWHHVFSAIFFVRLSIMFIFISLCLLRTIWSEQFRLSLLLLFFTCWNVCFVWFRLNVTAHWISHIYWKTIIIKSKLRNQLSQELCVDWGRDGLNLGLVEIDTQNAFIHLRSIFFFLVVDSLRTAHAHLVRQYVLLQWKVCCQNVKYNNNSNEQNTSRKKFRAEKR